MFHRVSRGFGLWVLGFGLWAVGCGLWVVGCGLWAVGCGLWVSSFGFKFFRGGVELRIQVLGLKVGV